MAGALYLAKKDACLAFLAFSARWSARSFVSPVTFTDATARTKHFSACDAEVERPVIRLCVDFIFMEIRFGIAIQIRRFQINVRQTLLVSYLKCTQNYEVLLAGC